MKDAQVMLSGMLEKVQDDFRVINKTMIEVKQKKASIGHLQHLLETVSRKVDRISTNLVKAV